MTAVRIEDGRGTLTLGHAYATGTHANSRGAFSETAVKTAYIGRNLSYNTDGYYGYGPFARCKDLETVSFGNQVTTVGTNCFYQCFKLNNFMLGEAVENINASAFLECVGLTSVHLPHIKTIGNSAFYGCTGITKVVFATTLTSIGESAFNNCSSLPSVIIPSAVTSIGAGAFYKCYDLAEVKIEDSRETLSLGSGYNNSNNSLSRGAFSETGVQVVYIGRNLSYNSDGYYGYGPFARCPKLTTVTFGDRVTSIGTNFFYNSTKLKRVQLGAGITSIGESAFQDCESLTAISLGNVSSIGKHAFKRTSLMSISIPASMTSIGDCAFYGCYQMTEVRIEDASTALTLGTGNYNSSNYENSRGAFTETGVQMVYVGRNLSYNSGGAYGYAPFARCQSLKRVALSQTLTKLGDNFFKGCDNIYYIVSGITAAKLFTIPESAFSETAYQNAALFVPVGSVEKYETTNYWKNFSLIMENTGDIVDPDPDYENDYCDLRDVSTSSAYFEATKFLCERGVLSGSKEDGKVNVDNELKRAHLAKIAFRGLYLSGGNKLPETVPSDNFPTVYTDLSEETAANKYYFQAAKALMYLDYGDGITPFDRDRLNFNPEDKLQRLSALKALMETFNILPDMTGADNPFPADNDVVALKKSNPLKYGYIAKAAQLGIITKDNARFRPFDNCVRGEAFVMLYRIMKKIESGDITDPNPDEKDYFEPLNTTLETIATGTGQSLGNFTNYSSTEFSLSGTVPLVFAHNYSSYSTTLPAVFYGQKTVNGVDEVYRPMGPGWSHSYHSFVTLVGSGEDARAIVHLGGGKILSYKSDGTKFVAESTGVYDELSMDGNEAVLKTKAQIEYRFTNQNGSGARVLYLAFVTDRNCNRLSINYKNGENGSKVIRSVTDGSRDLRFTYLSGTNLLEKVSDPLGREVSFEYTYNENTGEYMLTSFTNAEGNKTTYEYGDAQKRSTARLLTRIKMPKGNYIENEYDQNRRLTTTSTGIGGVPKTKTSVSVAADYSKGSVSTASNVQVERGGVTSKTDYTYNSNNLPTRITGEEGMKSTVTYGNVAQPHLPTAIETNSSTASNISYDSRGNMTLMTVAANNGMGSKTVRMTYNDTNDLTSYTDAMGNTTNYTYDSHGNLTEVSAPEGVTIKTEYNSNGLPVSSTDAMGVVTRYGYNGYGNVTSVSLPALGLESTMEYDDASRVISMCDFLGRTASTAYNNLDQVTKETDALGNKTTYAYDVNGNLTAVTNAKGGVTNMVYDSATDLLASITFDGASKQFSYNKDGSLDVYTKPDGTTLKHTYDALGRVTGDGVYSYSYDDKLRLEEIYGGGGKTLRYKYDGFNRVSEISYGSEKTQYSYDLNDHLVALTYPNGIIVRYGYDGLGRMTYVNDWNGRTTRYTYRKDSQPERVDYPNGMTTAYGYDEAGRLVSKKTALADGTVVAAYELELDKAGNIVRQTAQLPMDDAEAEDAEVKYTYNAGNRITKADGTNFSFDLNGNTTRRGDTEYKWDKLDRLVSAGDDNIEYDPLGNMRRYGSTTYQVNPLGMGDIIRDSRSKASYVYGSELVERVMDNGNTAYYVTDLQGSVVAIVDDNGNITHRYQYDEFGTVLQKEEADFNPFRFNGAHGIVYNTDNNYYMRARHYDPTIGRFLSEDPVWSTNLYPFCGNNPIMAIDPSGMNETIQKGIEIVYGSKEIHNIGSTTSQIGGKVVDNVTSRELGYLCEKTKDGIEATNYLNENINLFDGPKETVSSVGKPAPAPASSSSRFFGTNQVIGYGISFAVGAYNGICDGWNGKGFWSGFCKTQGTSLAIGAAWVAGTAYFLGAAAAVSAAGTIGIGLACGAAGYALGYGVAYGTKKVVDKVFK